MFLAVDQWWFSVSGAAADHHAGRGRHEDHVRCSSVSPGVQQWRGVRQAPAGVQLQSLSGREDLRHPEDLHDGGGDRPQRRAHGGGLIQRLRPADQNTERLAAHQQLQTDARSRSLQPRQGKDLDIIQVLQLSFTSVHRKTLVSYLVLVF